MDEARAAFRSFGELTNPVTWFTEEGWEEGCTASIMHVCLPFCGHNCMRYYPGERDSLLDGRGNKAYHHHSEGGRGMGWIYPIVKSHPSRHVATWYRRNPRERALGSRSISSSSGGGHPDLANAREISPFDAQLQRRRFFIRFFLTAESRRARRGYQEA